MNIKNKLYISAGISIVLVVALVSVVLVTSGRVAEESKKHELLDDVRSGVSELDVVTYDYLLHREKRMEQQWNIRYSSLGEILEKAEEEEMKSIHADYAALGGLFSQVTANYEKRQKLIQEGASQVKIDVAIGLEERLVAQLLITSHSIFTDAFRLAEDAQAEVMEAQRLAANMTLILMTILAITVATSSLVVARNISKPLAELTKGAEIIGKGDLEHKVDIKTRDELGELAAAFNKMTGNLIRNITERKRAEHKLGERVKELDCLYGVSQAVAKADASLEEILNITVNLLPPSWQYPEIACARIIFDDKEFKTHNFKTTQWKQSADIKIKGGKGGTVEVYYLQEKPESAEGPFLKEERELINGIARMLGEATERRRAEEKMRASAQQWQTTFDAISDAVCLMDLEGSIVQCNTAMANLLQKPFSEIKGRTCWELMHGTSEPIEGCPIARMKETHRKETKVLPIDDRWLEVSVDPLLNDDGSLIGAVHVVSDITERKRAEEELRKHRNQLEKLVEERTKELQDAQEQLVRSERLAVLGQLAGGVGHELRNPLGAIKNASYFLNMALEKPEPEVRETLDILEKEVATSEGIVSSLLDFARPKPPTRRKMNINEVVQETLSRTTLLENVKVVRQLDESLPEIMADPDQLRVVFSNIIRNGIQAMPEGGQLTVTSEVFRPGWVAVSIADTGVGIPPEEQPEVFEPLFTTKAKGIGLGLAVTSTLVEGHGGTIEVLSKVGKGSTFTVRLPISEEKEK